MDSKVKLIIIANAKHCIGVTSKLSSQSLPNQIHKNHILKNRRMAPYKIVALYYVEYERNLHTVLMQMYYSTIVGVSKQVHYFDPSIHVQKNKHKVISVGRKR